MKKIIFLLFLSLNIYGQNLGIVQSTNIGGNGTDEIVKAFPTTDGKIVILGSTTSTNGNFSANHGGKDVFVMKMDTLGTVIWTKMIGGTFDDSPVDIYEKVDGSFVLLCNTNSVDSDFTPAPSEYVTWTLTGPNKGGFVTCNLSSNGTSLSNIITYFHHNYSYIKPEGLSLALLPNQSSLFLYRNSIDGGNHILNSNQILWGTEFGNTCGRTTSSRIKKLSTNDFLSVGTISGASNTYNRPYGFNGTGCVPEDIFIVKYNASGSVQWTKNLGGTGYDYGVDFIEKNGFLYVTGTSNSTDFDVSQNLGSMDIYVAKLDLSGNLIKDTTLATSGRDIVNRMKLSSNGNIQIAGFTNNFQMQFYELNENLNILKNLNFNSPGNGNAIKDFVEIDSKLYLLSETSTQGPVGGGVQQGESSNSDVFLLKLGEVPPLLINPLSTSKYCIGQSIQVPFKTNLSGSLQYTAQLKRNGVIINSTSTNITNPDPTFNYNLYLYIPFLPTVEASNDYSLQIISGNTTSNVISNIEIGNISQASITDITGTIIPNPSFCSGKSYTFKILPQKSDYTPSVANSTFEWFLNGNSLNNFTDSININSNGNYSVTVKQGGCTRNNSLYASFNAYVNPYIIKYGRDVICQGQTRELRASYFSNTAQYTWKLNDVVLNNQNSNTLQAAATGTYELQILEPGCTVFSRKEKLTFSTGLRTDDYIISNGDTTICNGSYVNIQMPSYSYAPNEYAFQWFKNGTPIQGATYSGYSTNQPGKYSFQITQGDCQTMSRVFDIIASNQSQKPVFLDQSYTSTCSGSILLEPKFLTENGYYNTSYKAGNWYRDNVKVSTFQTYQFNASVTGVYKMIINEGNSCQVESDPISLTFGSPLLPKISAQNNRTTLCTGYVLLRFVNSSVSQSANFYQYQWYKNGLLIPGQVGQYLDVFTPGSYSLRVTTGTCTQESDPIVVTQYPATQTLRFTNTDLACRNGLVKLEIDAPEFYNYGSNVSWYRDGTLVPNENETILYANDEGQYYANYNSGGVCSGTTNTVLIKKGPPSGFVASGQENVLNGTSANISISNCNGVVRWYDSPVTTATLFTGQTFTSPILNSTTSYWVTCEKDFCESNRVEIAVAIGNPCPAAITHNSPVSAQEYLSSGYILSSTNLPTGVKYNANNYIELSPGFQVGDNEVFEAVIGGCEN